MIRTLRSVAFLAAVSLACVPLAPVTSVAQPATPPPPLSTTTPTPGAFIVTTATEEAEVTPDRAMLTFSVLTRGRTAAAAGAENARIQAAVLDTLRKLGIQSAQLRTPGISINPEYEYPRDGGRPTVVGYQAQNSVQAEIRQIAAVGAIIDAGLAKGATNVGSLRFFASSTDAEGRLALQRAMLRARADADAIAEAAGGRIVGVVQVTVLPSGNPQSAEGDLSRIALRSVQAAAAVETPIESGSLKLVVSIEAKFLFAPRM